MNKEYDVIVLGAGHAGVEAANIASKLNKKTALITFSKNDISQLHCNVSIGGPAKGIVVRELSVMGGLMPLGADNTQLQTKILNSSKGPAVKVIRTQIDKINYPKWMQNKILESDIDLIEGVVVSLIVQNNSKKVNGVILENGTEIKSKTVIITAGTFLSSKTLQGKKIKIEGPNGNRTISSISDQLRDLGIKTIRLKTGTPPRILKNSIDFTKLTKEPGSNKEIVFSKYKKIPKQFQNIDAYLGYTNEKTHEIINQNIELSYLYSEEISGSGPRYCPSIEDKVKRFSNKDRHQIFLELESEQMDTIYLSGLSSSLPPEVQEKFVRSISGLENAVFKKYAYAIEYDSIDPKQLKQTLELKEVDNLFMAGQVNGTSGYEEAAGQGFIAGVNASRKIDNKSPFIIDRDEGYLGVMIDDITTKGILDPYRLLTSRAEYRLLLRNDNAEQRLYKKAYEFDLITKNQFDFYESKFSKYLNFKEFLKTYKISIKNKQFNNLLNQKSLLEKFTLGSYDAFNLIKRPEFELNELIDLKIIEIPSEFLDLNDLDFETISIEIKFEGYLLKQQREVKKYKSIQNTLIPKNINYKNIPNLAIEAIEKMEKFKPISIHQASNISGINPSDIMILWGYIKNG